MQWQAAEGEDAAAKEELKKEESSESEEEEQEEITGCLLPQDLSKLDVAALTPLTPEVIRCRAFRNARTMLVRGERHWAYCPLTRTVESEDVESAGTSKLCVYVCVRACTIHDSCLPPRTRN